MSMGSLAADHFGTQTTGPAAPPAHGGRLTANEEASTVAELKQVAGWARLLAECAGLVLGYGEHECDAARYPADRRPLHRRRDRRDADRSVDRGRAPAGQYGSHHP